MFYNVIIITCIIFSGVINRLPTFISENLIKNPFFKMAVIALIILVSEHNIKLSLALLILFIVVLVRSYEQNITDGFLEGIKEGMMDDIADEIKSLDSNESTSPILPD